MFGTNGTIGMVDLTPLANALISILGAVLTYQVIPWIRAKAGQARAESLGKWARIGVQAAEQVYQGQADAGKKKFAYVEQFLAERGFKLDTQEVEKAIESAVFELTKEAVYGLPASGESGE